jgi:L,D-transpeptidase YbiS
MQSATRRIEVRVAEQRLRLLEDGKELASFPVSTSKFGLGFEEGSNHTPLGNFVIGRKIGDAEPSGTIFKSREVVGRWQPGDAVDEDLVLTRILWLHGQDEENANTRDRYIYIHGTNDEEKIGEAASHGCVRMRNADVMALYEMVDESVPVSIIA